MKKLVGKNTRSLLVLVVLILVGVPLGIMTYTALLPIVFGQVDETRDTQVVTSIQREEQVVLLSLGIQGIAERNQHSTFFGLAVPGSDRALFLMYEFSAKLGIEGEDVKVTKTGDKSFEVSIPEFIFVGHSNVNFRLVAENNGILSWTSPEISTVDMVNKVLNGEAQAEYLAKHRDLLVEQARSFYEGIIRSVDPTITVTFKFTSPK